MLATLVEVRSGGTRSYILQTSWGVLGGCGGRLGRVWGAVGKRLGQVFRALEASISKRGTLFWGLVQFVVVATFWPNLTIAESLNVFRFELQAAPVQALDLSRVYRMRTNAGSGLALALALACRYFVLEGGALGGVLEAS